MAGNKIGDSGTAAAVDHRGELDTGDLREPLDDDVLQRAESWRDSIVQPRMPLCKRDQFADRTDIQRWVYREHYRLTHQLDDGRKVIQRIDMELDDMTHARD